MAQISLIHADVFEGCWFVDILAVDIGDWSGSLFYLNVYGIRYIHQIDILFTRELILWWKDKRRK